MIDQAWQPRLAEGMVRAYLVEDRVTGFGHQAVNALTPHCSGSAGTAAVPRPDVRPVPGPEAAARVRLDRAAARACGVPASHLPLLWDCDFMLGDPATGDTQRYVLCEVNVSSVSPFPPSSIAPIVAAVKARLAAP